MVFLGRLLPYTLSTNRAPLCNNTKPTVHTPPEDGFFPEVGCPETKTDPKFLHHGGLSITLFCSEHTSKTSSTDLLLVN